MEVKSDHREAEGISRLCNIFVTRYSERGPAQIAPAKLVTLQEIEGPKRTYTYHVHGNAPYPNGYTNET